MTPRNPSDQPTLEDLIRLKRAERPPADFWKRFEEELRAKQLAAIVEPRPWWQSLTVLLSGRRAMIAGFGAAAAVAAVGYLRLPSNQALVFAQAVVREVSASAQGVASTPSTVTEKPAAQPVAVVGAVAAPAATPSSQVAATDHSARSEDLPRAAAVASSVVSPVLVTFSEIQVPPPRSALATTVPATTRSFASSLRTELGSSEPLASISAPQEQRGARFAIFAEVAMLPASAISSSARSQLTPRDSDLRDRDIGRLSAKANALRLDF